MPTTISVDRVVQTWDLYNAGSYSQIVESKTTGGDLGVLQALARLEIESNYTAPAGTGLFAELLDGMAAFHTEDFPKATKLLGAWLQRKSYFTVLAMKRFLIAAEAAEEHHALYEISRRFLDRKQYHELLIGPLFRAAFALEQYAACGTLFDKYRKLFRDPLLLHKTALALLYLNRNAEAEKILMALHKKMTGSAYSLDYDKVARQYEPIIRQIPDLEKRKRGPEEEWELGMAYLFNQQYDLAMNIFSSLQRTAA